MKLKLLLAVFFVCTALSLPASKTWASPGITGYSGNPATHGGAYCSACHSGATGARVTISGPTTAAPGSVNSYTLAITGGPLAGGATDISASGGTLGAGTGDSLSGTEITGGPTSPSGSTVSFPFTWTAPSSAGTYTIYGAGNSVNMNKSTSGDSPAAATLVVTVSGSSAATLTGLAISGTASLSGGSTATYTAKATYSDGTSKSVIPTWSVTPTTYASISTSGVLTTKSVTSNQTVTVNASYTEGGVTKTASLSVTITTGNTATLTGLAISGPGSLTGGSTGTYTATASYSNGSSKSVAAAWSVAPATYANINSSGILSTTPVTSNQNATVTASYTEGGVTKTASFAVTITSANSASGTLSGLAVKGPASVIGGTTATFSAQASYADGSTKIVAASWSATPTTYAGINKTSGVLTAGKVKTDTSVTVTASYTQSGVTKTAFVNVVISSGTHPPIGSVNNSGVVVFASNDLGMHCVCPSYSKFMVLPPYNTIRAQVIQKGGEDDAQVLGASSGIRVTYSISENTDASLKADPYYQDWMTNAPKLGFKAFPVLDSNGHIQSPITGAKLAGNMNYQSPGWWEIVGVPAFPDVSSLSTAKPMTDPLGGPNRNPYLTGNIKVYNSSNKLLAQTSVTIPTGFGGCCSCHLKVAAQMGFPATEQGSFDAMGLLHSMNSSGINIALIDPDGDGKPGPIRCSQCHLDPAMGDKTPPGGYTLNGKLLPVSKYTFSDVLHRFHATDAMVLGEYDPNIAQDCYQCHPGNGINCYRDHHTTESQNGGNKLWCTNCHGDLNQRIAQNQMAQPWSVATLPKCSTCHGTAIGENPTLGVFGGAYLNSMMPGMGGKLLCTTCHGSPHALNPSTLWHDNMQNAALQGGNTGPIGTCNVCHTGMSGYAMPPHTGDGGGDSVTTTTNTGTGD